MSGGMAGRPRISVAMATFNGERFIDQQLASLASQTLGLDELVVCDDGSTDRTLEIVRTFAESASFAVNVHRNTTRLGYRMNFMHAAGLCQGDLVAFCDQDDIWYDDKLARMVACFDDPEVLLAYHDYDLADASGALYEKSDPKEPIVYRALSCPPTWNNPQGFCMVWRRDLLDFSHVYPHSRCKAEPGAIAGHDQWISYLASALGTSVHVRLPLAAYRQHGANVFGKGDGAKDPRDELDLLIPALQAFRECLSQARSGAWVLVPAIEANGSYVRHLQLRRAALSAPRLWTRIRCFARLCLAGAYLRLRWPLGRRTLFRDACFVIGLR